MRNQVILFFISLIFSVPVFGQTNAIPDQTIAKYPDTLKKESPLALVQRQLNAYNARDIEAFLEPYSLDIEIYEFPNKLSFKGKEAMRKAYLKLFQSVPALHCEIKERIVQGNVIIDKESITGFGDKALEATVIYCIENNKIAKVYLVN